MNPEELTERSNRFCSQCGATLDLGAKFCPACGRPVQKQETSAPQPASKEKKKRYEIVFIILILFVVVIGLLSGPSGRNDSPPSSASAQASASPSVTPQESDTASGTTMKVDETQSVEATAIPTASPTPTPTPFQKRTVKYDLQGEKPDKEDQILMAIIKNMKWSLSGDPDTAAREDAYEFRTVAEGMKSYPDFVMSVRVMSSGGESFAQASREIYNNVWRNIVGGTFDVYWTKAIGESPQSSLSVFGNDTGITAINDVLSKALNDPDSFKFDHFTTKVDPSRRAWKVDYYYRAKNGFGAMTLTHNCFYMHSGDVVGMERPRD